MNIAVLNIPQAAAIAKSGEAVKAASGQATIVQGYAQTVQRQPMVDFKGMPNLATSESDINGGIKAAQTHAGIYLDTILPEMILQSSNMNDYLNVQNALATALDPSAPAKDAISMMKAAHDQMQDYQNSANGLVTDLTKLRTNLNTDSGNFAGFVKTLNATVDGDGGVLDQLDSEVDDINTKIDVAIAGAALSGLTIAGGGLMIASGAIADFFTAGASTPLVVAGVAVVAVGVAGAAASGIAIGVLLNQKNKILTQKSLLKAEVKLAQGMSGGFASLATKAGSAADAAQDMANAWTGLSQDQGKLIASLENGQTDVASMRKFYQIMAKGSVKNVKSDVAIIRQQLAGVNKINVPLDQDIGTALQDHFKTAA